MSIPVCFKNDLFLHYLPVATLGKYCSIICIDWNWRFCFGRAQKKPCLPCRHIPPPLWPRGVDVCAATDTTNYLDTGYKLCAAGWINMNTNHWRYWAERSGFIHFHLDNKNKKRMQKTKWLHQPQISPDVNSLQTAGCQNYLCTYELQPHTSPPSDVKTQGRLNLSLTEDYYNSSSLYLSSVTWAGYFIFSVTKERRTNLSQVTFTRSLSPLWRISRRAGFTVIHVASGSCSDWICTHERTSNKTRGTTGSTLICGLTGTPAETNNWELNIESCRIFQYGDVSTGNEKKLMQLFGKSSENIQTFS